MSEQEFEESARLYAKGLLSRRRFVGKLVAGGLSVTAAVAFATATTADASRPERSTAKLYGTPPGKDKLPKGLEGESNHGHGAPTPREGGTPPGKAKKH